MKKFIVLMSFCFLVLSLSAQSSFFKPIDQVVKEKSFKAKGLDTLYSSQNGVLLFRPSVTLTAAAVRIKSGQASIEALNSAGIGISYGKFTQQSGQAYCNYSLNASLLTSVKLGESTSAKVGFAITADCFNKLVGAGIGIIDNSVVFLTTLSYSF